MNKVLQGSGFNLMGSQLLKHLDSVAGVPIL